MAREFLPLVDACVIVGVAYNVAWRLAVQGKVRARRQGRSWLVQLDELRRATAAVPARASAPKGRAPVAVK